MKSSRLYAVLALLILSGGALAQEAGDAAQSPENKPAAAVYVTGDVPGYYKEFLGAYMANSIINDGADVNDENAAAFLTAADTEQSKRKTPLDDSLICKLGREFGIRYICAATITSAPDGAFTLSARIISTKTGKSRYNSEAAGQKITMGALAQASEAVLEKMFGGRNIFGGQTRPEPTPEPVPAAKTADSVDNTAADTAAIAAAVDTDTAEIAVTDTAAIATAVNTDTAEIAVTDTAAIVTAVNTDTTEIVAVDTAVVAAAQEPEEMPKIAVYVAGDVSENDKTALGTRMLATLVNSGRYRGIERSAQFLAEIDREHIKQRSGDVDDSQISALGKQFGVNFVCVAAITPALGSYQVSARIINVETAEVTHIGESNSPLKTIGDLTIVSSEVVSNMFGRQLSITPSQRMHPKSKYSFGVGALYVGGFDGGIVWSSGQVAMPYSGGGVYLFVGHTYAYAHIAYLSGGGQWESDNRYDSRYDLPDMRRIDLNIGIFGKYPITILENITAFPIAGLDYSACASARLVHANGSKYAFDGIDGRHVTGDLNELWVRFGAGVDVDISWNTYMRGELLYGARLANAFEQSYLYDGYTKLGHGLMLKVGAGIRF